MNIIGLLRSFMLPVKEINTALPKEGVIYEIGSGWGSLAKIITEGAPHRTVVGIDIDSAKVVFAQKKYACQRLQYVQADALTYNFKIPVGFVMSDFLHHLSFATQEKLVRRLTAVLPPKGRLVIKEIDRNDGVLMWCSRLWDFLLYPHDQIYYRSKVDWEILLKKMGLKVRSSRAVLWFPGSTHLFICQKNTQ